MTKTHIDLSDYWPYQVVVLADLVSRHTNAILKEHGSLNLSQWRVLAAIADKPGSTAAEVVQVTPMDKGIVSRATATLVTEGLVRKKTDDMDKRRAELFLTPVGQSHYDAVNRTLGDAIGDVKVPHGLNAVLRGQIDRMRAVVDGP